jgi:DNA gyrase subunit B
MAEKVQNKYQASSIKILEGLEAVRQRPGMYIGSTDKYGLHHLVYEVVDNSVDEALAGYCTEITVTIQKDNAVKVQDNGRGIPIDKHPEAKIPAAEVVLTKLHAGGKFEKEGYKVSGGLHGVGVSVVNALSEWLLLEIHRDKKVYKQKFTRGGVPTTPEIEDEKGQKDTSTCVTFLADDTIFETLDFTYETLAHRFRELAYLNKGLKITFIDERGKKEKTEVFEFEGGLLSFVEHQVANKATILEKPFYMLRKKEDVEAEIALTYVKDYYDEIVISFANNIRTKEGGTHLAGFRTALTRSINNFAKRRDMFGPKDEPLTGNDVKEGLIAIVSVKLPQPQFEGQTKNKLGNSEIKGLVDSLFDEAFSDWMEKNPGQGKQIINAGLASQRVRNATRHAQELARRKNALEGSTLPGKLADCSERDPSLCELYIVEGDSAGGSAKQGRDRTFQAILPLRGKILNVEKSRIDKILQNEELRNLITAIGPEAIESLYNKDDEEDEDKAKKKPKETKETAAAAVAHDLDRLLNNLRYHRIIIMTDADVDGAHIRTLLLTFFFRYARSVIEAGCLYIAQPPLYLVKKGKTEKYAYNEKELETTLKEFGKENSHVQRYKGLGEMNPEQLWTTTMDPHTRTLLKVEIDEAEAADEIFTILMGTEVEPRKDFIQAHAKKVRFLDI